MTVEFKVTIPGRKQAITLTKREIEVLLKAREEGWADVAERLSCSRENLSRLINGRDEFPILRKKFVQELTRMIVEQKHKKSTALAMVV